IGQAQATAQNSYGVFNSVQAMATSPIGGTTPAIANAQVGGTPSNAIDAGHSFSVINGFQASSVAFGSMGAGYGGTGAPLTYQESASFTQNGGGLFILDLLSNNALGTGFDSVLFNVSLNNNVLYSESFTDLASAQSFFSNNLIDVPLDIG